MIPKNIQLMKRCGQVIDHFLLLRTRVWSRSVTIGEPAKIANTNKNKNTNTNTSAGADKDVDQLPCGNTFRKLTKIHLQIQIEIKIAIPIHSM